jgi:hypothetical protein
LILLLENAFRWSKKGKFNVTNQFYYSVIPGFS